MSRKKSSASSLELPEVNFSEDGDIRYLHLGTERIQGPMFLELKTYRFRAHSMFDPELYRQKAEVEEWKKRCPIDTFQQRARQAGWIDDDTVTQMVTEIDTEISGAVAFAETGTWEPVETLTRHVYARVA